MRRLKVFLLSVLMAFSFTSIAEEEVVQEAPKKEVQNNGPVQAIQTAIVKLNQLTKAAIYSPRLLNTLVEQEVAPLFDFDHIADEVLLVVNDRMDTEEKIYFTNKLKKNIVSALLAKLSQARSTSFQFISARPMMGGSIAVQLKVNGYSPYGIYIDLLFHQNSNKEWKIFDVVLNNDSLTNYYQKMVLIKIRRYGIYGMLGRL